MLGGRESSCQCISRSSWDCAAAYAEDISSFVDDDKFSVIKDSFNDDNTEILLLLLNYDYDFCHIGYIILLSDWKMSKSTKIALTRSFYFIIIQVGKVSRKISK